MLQYLIDQLPVILYLFDWLLNVLTARAFFLRAA